MKNTFTRNEILSRIEEVRENNEPIIGAGCSAGIIAKCAEYGGADFIIVYSTGLSRLKGHPTTPYGDMDTNDITLQMADEISEVVDDTPIIGGICAQDPNYRDLDELIDDYLDAGYSGIINFPTIAMYGDRGDRWREMRESQGFGWTREVEMMKRAHEKDVFTIAYVWSPEDAKEMAEIPADILCPHAGGTSGGKAGYEAAPKEDAAEKVQNMIDAIGVVNEDAICVAHGGPFAEPEDTQYLYDNTDAKGFIGASSIERIPVEKAVENTVKRYKDFKI
ncbi:hypothetical protein AKJ40_03975 [candidate division MSBL1 archaeon SCGC-AAA259M10]|uniref:TIM-barrel domain-containing protein n=2 Tax=candidate division MSBL1 TaxID=215777 RepID=A0A133U2W9_9EURY|nr:hypothetical protein AKJ62_04960 [candidate division MSBL1 archaeon SCGC-AAA259D14]KXA99087.1 hypothetical protein AKJ40_03975 [candidate division MSBL1 archaeon SCGC-AAA259M10]